MLVGVTFRRTECSDSELIIRRYLILKKYSRSQCVCGSTRLRPYCDGQPECVRAIVCVCVCVSVERIVKCFEYDGGVLYMYLCSNELMCELCILYTVLFVLGVSCSAE